MEPEVTEVVKEVKVVGELRSVDLKDDGGGTFRLRLEDGSEVSGEFDEFHEAIITRAFSLHQWDHLAVKADAQFDASGALCHLTRVKEYAVVDPGETPIFSDTPPPEGGPDNGLLKMIEELDKKYPVPEEESLPSDFAKNFRNYRSGFPREEE